MKSKSIASVLILVIALAFTIPALAGGWAVITLEALPTNIVVGQPLNIRFAVRQHGRTLMEGLTPTVSARNGGNGESFSVGANPIDGQPGYYQVTLTFPSVGTWEWSIQAFTMNQRMNDLVVSTSAPAASAPPERANGMPILVGVAGLAVALAAFAFSILKRARWALVLIVLGLVVGGAGFASAASKDKKAGKQALANDALRAGTLVETGRALFVVKGCVTCHVNARVEDKYYDFRSDIGPNLTQYAASPEFLRLWLKNPASVRPNTQMPNLELESAEIEALIAFLSDKSGPGNAPTNTMPPIERVVTATPRIEQRVIATPSTQIAGGEKSACSNLDSRHGLLVSYARDIDSYISLIDPATGNPLCGYAHLNLGGSPVYTYSPDRSSLAALSAETPDQLNWRLQWIDLLSWKVADVKITIPAWVNAIAIDPDRSHLAIVYSLPIDATDPRFSHFQLEQVSVSGKEASKGIKLDINPRLMSYSSDGRYIILYGAQANWQGMSVSSAKIRIYAASDLSLVWETQLNDVHEGPIENTSKGIDDPERYALWMPALALSPDRGKLYIVHADSDRLTTVDLIAHKANTVDIQPRLGWLERMLSLTAGVAHAKTLNGTSKQAALSPDGAHLYVTGFTGLPHKDNSGNLQFDILPLGLQEIDVTNGREIARLKSQDSEIDLSADGKFLFLRGSNDGQFWTDVLNADGLGTIAHLTGQYVYPARTLAGEGVILGSDQGQQTLSLNVLDGKTFSEFTKLKGDGYWISAP